MKASRKADLTLQRGLWMALLTARAEQAELGKTIDSLTRSLADVAGIPASYPPPE
jgi:hypothetical protein